MREGVGEEGGINDDPEAVLVNEGRKEESIEGDEKRGSGCGIAEEEEEERGDEEDVVLKAKDEDEDVVELSGVGSEVLRLLSSSEKRSWKEERDV